MITPEDGDLSAASYTPRIPKQPRIVYGKQMNPLLAWSDYQQADTGTSDLGGFTIDGVLDRLPKLQNTEILQQLNRERAGHVVKGLVITVCMVHCLP